MDVSNQQPLPPPSRRETKLTALLEVAKALSAERDLDSLLRLIMREAAKTVEAERCSLFVLDATRGELWSRVAQGAKGEIRVPISQGIVGAVARSGEALNLDDAYQDPRFQRDWDVKTGYRTRSVLCVPMKRTTGEVTGVIQALNSTKGRFDAEDEELLLALGGQAASAVENAMLSEDIARLFEGFVQASVMAIESRDPSTAGHSGRVATMSVALAEAAEQSPSGPYRDIGFNREQIQELRYAALLHDFGKIGVRESVLVKAEKLYPQELALLVSRFEIARKDRQFGSMQRRLERMRLAVGTDPSDMEREEELRLARELKELDEMLSFILECNRPTVGIRGGFERLTAIAENTFSDSKDKVHQLLTPNEQAALSISQGSLSSPERREIESHVTHTFRFLSQIPWTRSLKRVPEIAYGHHERLDGTGYPRALAAEEIPLQTKMISIADVYDALTASDRPYKHAVAHEGALEIIASEVKRGKLDGDLFKIFVEGKVPQNSLKRRGT